MSTGAIIAVGALGVVVCCSSSVAAVMMGGDGESNVGKVCTPQGTPDPNATYKYGANDACVMTCKTGYEKKDGACVEKTLGPSSSSGSLTFHSSTLPTDATIFEPGEITSVIKSPNNQYSLVLQGDDNLCVRGPTEAKWCLMSQDLVNGRAHFQGDGNLCVYGDNGSMCTASHDLDVPSGQHRLVLKNNGTMYVDHGTGVSGQSLVTNW